MVFLLGSQCSSPFMRLLTAVSVDCFVVVRSLSKLNFVLACVILEMFGPASGYTCGGKLSIAWDEPSQLAYLPPYYQDQAPSLPTSFLPKGNPRIHTHRLIIILTKGMVHSALPSLDILII